MHVADSIDCEGTGATGEVMVTLLVLHVHVHVHVRVRVRVRLCVHVTGSCARSAQICDSGPHASAALRL